MLLGLAACRSVDPGLGVAPAEPAAAPAPVRVGPIGFLPVVGMPADKAASLSQALARSASASGIAIQGAEGGTAPQRLKGYLSTIREPEDTLVIYVWDVVDPGGERLSRIQGQIRVPGADDGGDPWNAVGIAEMSEIADRTVAALRDPAAASAGDG